jgi:hypothetical protein
MALSLFYILSAIDGFLYIAITISLELQKILVAQGQMKWFAFHIWFFFSFTKAHAMLAESLAQIEKTVRTIV